MRIRHKLLVALVVVALVSSLLMAVGSVAFLRAAVRGHHLERVRAEVALLAAWAAQGIPPLDPQQAAEEAARDLGVRVTLIDARGVVLGDSARPGGRVREMENHLDRPEVAQALSLGQGERFRTSATTGLTYLYVARRVEGAGPVRFVRLAIPAAQLSRIRTGYFWSVAGFTFLALLGIGGGAYLVVRRIAKPIERMSDAASRAAAGELTLKVPAGAADEVSRLGDAVNRMREALIEQVNERETDRRFVLSVLSGIQEGLVVVDRDHRIRLANAAFRRIFSVEEDPGGRLLAEVVRNPTMMNDLDRVFRDAEEIRETVIRAPDSGRSFELHLAPLFENGNEGPSGALLLFFDVTRLEALERIRQTFIADVSHELRTPLTSIRAFVETLEAGALEDPGKSREFLEIIRRHAGRMEALIDDLTDLSRIETGALELDLQEVAVGELAADVVAQVAQRYADLEVRAEVDVPRDLRVRADRRRLEQILVNLVDNAFKFNRPGGTVRITAERNGRKTVLVVEDTGIGIPADSLENVFRRFYRVDKARSREAGGTGLGLAIVKHLMRLHGGTVRAESEPGRGSRFILEFPVAG